MNSQIKMIVSDLDGTLLRTDKTVSAATRAALARCREKGIKVAYATARGRSAEVVTAGVPFDGRAVMNGAIAYAGEAAIYNRLIPYAVARPLLMACDAQEIKTASELAGMQYTNFVTTDLWPELDYFEVVDFSRHSLDAEKLYAVIEAPGHADYISQHLPDELYMTLSNDGLAMIMHREASKSKAIAALARTWGIEGGEIVCFGDDLNDIDMLRYAGTGVAMANAHNTVKAAANNLTSSNDEDGVADWLNRHLL